MAESRTAASLDQRLRRPPPDKGTKAARYAADAIRSRILAGLLSPGQRLIEAELMAELEVGRSTVREACLRLEADGLVELRHQRGAVVVRLTRRDMAELFEVREPLEGLAAALAAANVGGEGNRQWLLDERARWLGEDVVGDAVDYMEYNVELHQGIVQMSGNQRLLRVLEPLQVPGYRLQFLRLLDAERRQASAAEHVTIIDAILAEDGALAERLVRRHVRRAGELAQQIPELLD